MIIGVSGKKRSGKDTFYKFFKELLPEHEIKKYAFADLVKEYAIKYFSIPLSEIKNENHRFILQGLGQAFREEVSKTYWVDHVFSEIKESQNNNPNEISIITDVRYRNEAKEVEKHPESFLVNIQKTFSENSVDFHQSENDLNNYEFEHVIINNGDLDDYKRKIEKWIEKNLLLTTRW